jgi:hypothetical protein
MAKRIVLSVRTPLNYRVILTRDRWREIVRFKHPAVARYEKRLRDCLERPDVICASTKDDDVHVYYLQTGKAYLCVVAAPAGGDDRFVVTAYLAKRIKPGRQLWIK